ncbi:MAG: nucleotidyltransferase family protein [Thermofilaceae archaeon]
MITKFNKNLIKCIFIYNNLKDFYIKGYHKDEKVRDIMISILNSDIELLRCNKLLVSLGEFLIKNYLYTNEILSQRVRRYEIYHQETYRIFQEFGERGVKALCIKTFTSIPKDIADIDILLYDDEDLKIAEKSLIEMGYKKRKKGLEQHLWTIIKNNVIIDIELHTNVAAASYIYYPKAVLFDRSEKLDTIVVPSPIDSILLLVAHAVMKDFFITLADLLDFEVTLKKHKIDFKRLNNEAASLGLTLPLQVFRYASSLFNPDDYKELDNILNFFSITKLNEFPLRPNMHTVLLSYLFMTTKKLKHESFRSVLSQIIHLPTGKGIDYFVKFAFGGKPPIKGLSE